MTQKAWRERVRTLWVDRKAGPEQVVGRSTFPNTALRGRREKVLTARVIAAMSKRAAVEPRRTPRKVPRHSARRRVSIRSIPSIESMPSILIDLMNRSIRTHSPRDVTCNPISPCHPASMLIV